jgi:hypothetical protein
MYEEQEEAVFVEFLHNFSSVNLIVDGKAILLRRFDSDLALVRYEEPLVKKDYMCFKHKPACISMLFQVDLRIIFIKDRL